MLYMLVGVLDIKNIQGQSRTAVNIKTQTIFIKKGGSKKI